MADGSWPAARLSAQTLRNLPAMLRKTMNERGLSYRAAAEQMGLQHNTVFRTANATTQPRLDHTLAMLDWLGCPCNPESEQHTPGWGSFRRVVPEPVWEGPRWRTVEDHGQPPVGALAWWPDAVEFWIVEHGHGPWNDHVLWLAPDAVEPLLPPLSAVEPPPQPPDVPIPRSVMVDFLNLALCNAPDVPIPWDDPAVRALFSACIAARDERDAALGAAAGAMKEGDDGGPAADV